MSVDGWVPVNPLTLETAFPDVYAVGDVTSVGTPKAGVFAEGQASVVAAQIGSLVHGRPPPVTYDGHGVCYLEFGNDLVARVEVTFLSGSAPVGDIEGPSQAIAADKSEFGTSRIDAGSTARGPPRDHPASDRWGIAIGTHRPAAVRLAVGGGGGQSSAWSISIPERQYFGSR